MVYEFEFIIGERLKDEKSTNGLYALMTKDLCLRISLDHEIAKFHSQDNSRYLAEVWLR